MTGLGVRTCASALWAALREAAGRAPRETAIRCWSGVLSNAELAAAVAATALRLAEAVPPASRVAVSMAPGLEQHVAILGTVVAGCAYVPVDVSWSAERAAYVCADAEVALVITDGRGPVVPAQPMRFGAIGAPGAADLAAMSARADAAPPSAVYAMYTSGTTGAPKGVETGWAALRNRLDWMQDLYPLTPADVVLSKTSCGFDVSVWEYLWPRLHGARTSVLDVRADGGWSGLWRVLAEDRVTVCHFVPSVARAALRDPAARPVESLRMVALSGEVLDRGTAAALQRIAPNARIVNMYGPTECAIDVSHWTYASDQPWDPVPIGGGAANCGLELRGAGERGGELVIYGVQVADGYIGAAAGSGGFLLGGTGRGYATGDVAVEVEPGVFSVVGRADRQVKLNGVRVELDGLEAVVRTHPAVEDCAVVLDTSDPVAPGVVVICAPRTPGTPPNTRALRRFIRDGSAMEDIAFRVLIVERLPLTASGKTDYLALAHRVHTWS